MARTDTPSVIVVGALPPPMHGQAAVNAAVAERLRNLPVALTVIDTSPGNAKRSIAYHAKRMIGVLGAAGELAKRRTRHDKALYMPFQAGNGIVYNLLLALISRAMGFRIVLHHHSSAHTLQRRRAFAFLAWLCGEQAIHVALSEEMAADLRKRYGLFARTIVSSNACHIPSSSAATSEIKPTQNGLVVGLLANLNSEKGLQLAIDTVVQARKRGARAKLVLAGPLLGAASEESVARASSILGESLEIWGPVDRLGKERFFRYVHVFLFPTTYQYEAQPLVIYEAMSYGIPIISTDAGYIPEMLARIGTVVRIGPNIRDELTTELLKFWNNPGLLARASRDAKREFETVAGASAKEFAELCSAMLAN